ncbi:MAG: Gfo/Idh/MocA family oxidoreductase [Pseudobacteriovorax sp.]|nr:Gfo/Idh/MocA family oxidoreductase [Pseudobacteriovorax sp.]
MKNFALIGSAGYIAPRHLKAIKDTGNHLVASVDPSDSVGVVDKFYPEAKFFTEIERFDRFLEKLRYSDNDQKADYISICSPNYLHDAHVRLALRVRAHAICEKPLTISPWNLEALEALEQEYGKRVYTILQLRLLESLKKIHLENFHRKDVAEVDLSYITRRGPWYHTSWKGQETKSGGIAMNIGIHFFDILLWIFGPCTESQVHYRDSERMAGMLRLERANVRWFLSIAGKDLPETCVNQGKSAFRSLKVDGEEIEFSTGFEDLHTLSYREILEGRGFGLSEAKPAIDLVHRINRSETTSGKQNLHPNLVQV